MAGTFKVAAGIVVGSRGSNGQQTIVGSNNPGNRPGNGSGNKGGGRNNGGGGGIEVEVEVGTDTDLL